MGNWKDGQNFGGKARCGQGKKGLRGQDESAREKDMRRDDDIKREHRQNCNSGTCFDRSFTKKQWGIAKGSPFHG